MLASASITPSTGEGLPMTAVRVFFKSKCFNLALNLTVLLLKFLLLMFNSPVPFMSEPFNLTSNLSKAIFFMFPRAEITASGMFTRVPALTFSALNVALKAGFFMFPLRSACPETLPETFMFLSWRLKALRVSARLIPFDDKAKSNLGSSALARLTFPLRFNAPPGRFAFACEIFRTLSAQFTGKLKSPNFIFSQPAPWAFKTASALMLSILL